MKYVNIFKRVNLQMQIDLRAPGQLCLLCPPFRPQTKTFRNQNCKKPATPENEQQSRDTYGALADPADLTLVSASGTFLKKIEKTKEMYSAILPLNICLEACSCCDTFNTLKTGLDWLSQANHRLQFARLFLLMLF